MKRGGFLKRHTRLRPRRKTPRRSARQRDTEYMDRVRGLLCCAPPDPNGHSVTMDAHHAGKRGAGQKCSDQETIPLCHWHHMCWHNAGGPFHGWTREQRRTWADARIAETRAKLRPRGVYEELAF